MNELTIFTPTYNRKHLLPFLYKSLCRQQVKNFLWLIIDDGSQDGTKSLVEKWIKENVIEIKYIYQENAGKHAAHNKAVEICGTDLFVCVDSDDIFTEAAVKTILDYWHKDKSKGRPVDFAGYCARKGNLKGIFNGKNWLNDGRMISFFDLYEKYKFRGELVLIWITSILKQYRFPQFKNERFVTENVLYYQVSYNKPMKLINDIFYLFEYKKEGYTKQGDSLYYRNPYGYAVYRIQVATLSSSFIKKIRWLARYKGWIKAFDLDKKILNAVLIRMGLCENKFFINLFSDIYSFHYKRMYKKRIKR